MNELAVAIMIVYSSQYINVFPYSVNVVTVTRFDSMSACKRAQDAIKKSKVQIETKCIKY